MGYYSDFFVRPKQAIAYAYDHPSLSRSLAFVILGTIAGVLAGLFFTGSIFPDIILSTLTGDVARWLAGGVLFLLFGALFKGIPLNGQSFSRALSVLAHLNVYGFFLFLVLGVLLPAVAIPDLIQASHQLNQGLIGETDFQNVLSDSLAGGSVNYLIALPLVGFAILLVFYSIYALYLSAIKYLDTTAFKAILASLVWVFVQGLIIVVFNTLLGT